MIPKSVLFLLHGCPLAVPQKPTDRWYPSLRKTAQKQGSSHGHSSARIGDLLVGYFPKERGVHEIGCMLNKYYLKVFWDGKEIWNKGIV